MNFLLEARPPSQLTYSCCSALAGRVWLPNEGSPAVVAVREQGVFNVSRQFAILSELCNSPDPAAAVRTADGKSASRPHSNT